MPQVLNMRASGVPDGAVYVGRPTKYGNPFTIAKHGRDNAVGLYEEWIKTKIAMDPEFHKQLIHDLRGKDLVCFCAPSACHAEVLMRIANA